MCTYSYCWIINWYLICVRFNYNTFILFPRGYGILCMLVAHNNTSTIHTAWDINTCGVLPLYTYSVVYLQDRALYWDCDRGDVVRAQELLALGANVNYRGPVSYIEHITHYSGCMCWVSIHCTDTPSVRSLWFTLEWYVNLSLTEAILQRHHQWNISYTCWYIPSMFDTCPELVINTLTPCILVTVLEMQMHGILLFLA